MATYKITAVTRSGEAPHDHVTSIDIGPYDNRPVADVRDAIDNADVYYVYGGGESAKVEKFDCECGAKTIKSIADATDKNDLSTVPTK
jgi:hypothetical protein